MKETDNFNCEYVVFVEFTCIRCILIDILSVPGCNWCWTWNYTVCCQREKEFFIFFSSGWNKKNPMSLWRLRRTELKVETAWVSVLGPDKRGIFASTLFTFWPEKWRVIGLALQRPIWLQNLIDLALDDEFELATLVGRTRIISGPKTYGCRHGRSVHPAPTMI